MRSRVLVWGMLLGSWSLFVGGPARGSGFGIAEQGARQMGMAGAVTAVADSPTAIFFNPAGMAQLDGLQAEVGVTYITPATTFTGLAPGTTTEVGVEAERQHKFLPNIYFTYRVHDRVAVGIGSFAPFGLANEWESPVNVNGTEVAWWGRGVLQEISVETAYINPTVAVKLHRRVLLGVGLSIVKSAVELRRAVTFSDSTADDIDLHLSGSDWGVGGTAGILIKVLPELFHVGVAYRSAVELTYEGDAAFGPAAGATFPPTLRLTLQDGAVEAPLTLPHVVSVGVAVFPIRRLTLGASVDVTTWQSLEQLEVRFIGNEQLNIVQPKDWSPTVTARVGAEYRVLPRLPLRAGFIFDQTAVPTTTMGPELPGANRYELTVGGGYKFYGVSVDLAYQYLATASRDTSPGAPLVGNYDSDAHLIGLSVGYALAI